MTYKVWMQIEALPEQGEPHNVDEPVDVLSGSTLSQARAAVQSTFEHLDELGAKMCKRVGVYPYKLHPRGCSRSREGKK